MATSLTVIYLAHYIGDYLYLPGPCLNRSIHRCACTVRAVLCMPAAWSGSNSYIGHSTPGEPKTAKRKGLENKKKTCETQFLLASAGNV